MRSKPPYYTTPFLRGYLPPWTPAARRLLVRLSAAATTFRPIPLFWRHSAPYLREGGVGRQADGMIKVIGDGIREGGFAERCRHLRARVLYRVDGAIFSFWLYSTPNSGSVFVSRRTACQEGTRRGYSESSLLAHGLPAGTIRTLVPRATGYRFS